MALSGTDADDEISFLRTGDQLCLACAPQSKTSDRSSEQVLLAAQGFGNRLCFLEEASCQNTPPDLSLCVYVLEQSLSVRALQEMVSTDCMETATQAGNRTLLYGHAILLRHSLSEMYLACLCTSSSRDKLAFDVGLQETVQGEACWWTIHPASKQRSEGEKVRIGDDLILVSVSSERYLHLASAKGNSHPLRVQASFQQTLWTVWPISSSTVKPHSLSFVNGLDVLRFFHGHLDEFLTVPPIGCKDDENNCIVNYQTGAVASFARSLWRIEIVSKKWNGGYISWGQPCRIRHITSGKYLAVINGKDICIVPRSHGDLEEMVFCLQPSKADTVCWDSEQDHGMGSADIKYGDSTAFIQHVSTSLWLSHMVVENLQIRSGKPTERKAMMHPEGHMDDGFSVARARGEEAKSAGIIRKSTSLFLHFISALDSLQERDESKRKLWDNFALDSVENCLEDLIEYFLEAEEESDHEEQQKMAKALRNRQDLFKEEGMVKLVLDTIDKLCVYNNSRDFGAVAGEEAAEVWENILNKLYELIASMIRNNHNNCALFAQATRLDWLIQRLESQQASTGVLDVLQCVLIRSPEALNIIKERHIKSMISQLEKHGRDPKVLDVLCSLCIGNGIAVRSNQNLICDHLLPTRDLLLQTELIDEVKSMRPNVFICLEQGSAVYKKWYFEVAVDNVENVSNRQTHFRTGWANSLGFRPYPRGGEGWGSSGVGDDHFSFGFDGMNLWTGGVTKPAPWAGNRLLSKGDIVGVCLDLTLPRIMYHVNGNPVKAVFEEFNQDGLLFPVISLSAKVCARFILGGSQGRFKFTPPKGFAAVSECLMPKEQLRIEPCLYFGDLEGGIVYGPTEVTHHSTFVPAPVDTSEVILPGYIEMLRDKLAENIHELWCMNKIEAGWTWGPVRDDGKKVHPCLTFFANLSEQEKNFDITMAYETLRTLIALGYHISIDEEASKTTLKRLRLPMNYLMSNGYKPAPYNLSTVSVTPKMTRLVEQLAENAHNVWARDRMEQGWTYGLAEDGTYRRNPQLIPYSQLDDGAKKLNRDTASETVRTILGFGYTLEPPPSEQQEGTFRGLSREMSDKGRRTRIFRAQKTYAVTQGKWYYELEVKSQGIVRVGWGNPSLGAGSQLGTDGQSYVFDGFVARKWFQGSESFGKVWQEGDVIGCMLNADERTISFTLNGEYLTCQAGTEVAFRDVEIGDGLVPVFMLAAGEEAHLYFGQDVYALKYFTICGLQEGYEPFCVNMKKSMPLWYSKSQPCFKTVDEEHPDLEVTRIPAGVEGPPCLRISHKKFNAMENLPYEFLRLSMPVECQDYPTSGELALSIQVPTLSPANNKRNIWKRQQGNNSFDYLETNSVDAPRKVILNGYNSSVHGSDSESDFYHDNLSSSSPNKAAIRRKLLLKHKRMESDTLDSETATIITDYDSDGGRLKGNSLEKDKRKLPLGRKFPVARSIPSETPTEMVVKDLPREPAPTPAKSKRNRFFTLKSTSMDAGTVLKDDGSTRYVEMNGRRSPGNEVKKPISRSTETSPPGTLLRHHPKLMVATESSVESSDIPKISRVDTNGNSFDVYKSMDIMSDVSEQDSVDILASTKYSFSIRIFPGQESQEVYVGWVTPGFHQQSHRFNDSQTREVKIHVLGEPAADQENFKRHDSFVIRVGDHLEVLTSPGGRRHTGGIVVGCVMDVSNGELSYYINSKEISVKHKVEPRSKLFPAVFLQPTCMEMVQFELGREKNCLPLSAAWFQGDAQNSTPQCPSRVEVQSIQMYSWSRVPDRNLEVETEHISESSGWQVATSETVPWLGVRIPEENSCMDILELIESEALLKYHTHTLKLYCAVCYRGNHRVGRAVSDLVNEDQLFYCLECPYLAGSLREGFHDLLIAIYLETHANIRLMTQDEFILPLGFEFKTDDEDGEGGQQTLKRALSNTQNVSIRPELKSPEESGSQQGLFDTSPPMCNIASLKNHVIDALCRAVRHGIHHCRDPAGGSYTTLFTPLLKVCDKLLVMGVFDADDMKQLLILIDPATFDGNYRKGVTDGIGILQLELHEPVKLAMCSLLQHLCDNQLRHRVESIVNFSHDFVRECQTDQACRLKEVRTTDMPPIITAKKTKEFRSTPQEQMRMLLSFKEPAEGLSCPAREDLRDVLSTFHTNLVSHCGVHEIDGKNGDDESWVLKLFNSIFKSRNKNNKDTPQKFSPDSLSKLISETMIKWAEEKHIEDAELVREIARLLHRQYNGVGELCQAISKTYVVSREQEADIITLLNSLSQIRSLLKVQMGASEEEAMIKHLWDLTDNKVFYQHPDLMRALFVHETVMNVMVNVLEKHQTSVQLTSCEDGSKKTTSVFIALGNTDSVSPDESCRLYRQLSTNCCRFLCYFCRTCRQNQRAMFDKLAYMLEHGFMGLSYPSLRGSCPLDVAAASLMDNNELALALREAHLEKVISYMSQCGVQDNDRMLSMGKPLIGWDPVDGERYLDFMRHTVWVNGETVEENANLVVRLLIRHPECLGPALRGEGQGLLNAMEDAIELSETTADFVDHLAPVILMEDGVDGPKFTLDDSPDEVEDDEDDVDIGGAVLTFYATLIDLLGRCAPDEQVLLQGRTEPQRIRAILRSLVPIDDLIGVLSLKFSLPSPYKVYEKKDEGAGKPLGADLKGLTPCHKECMLLFLERVYGISDKQMFFSLLEKAFLPDLRAAITMDTPNTHDHDMALALNRYMCNSVLPLLTRNAVMFENADKSAALMDATLHTVYRMASCRSLTRGQRDTIAEFLIALTKNLKPSVMQRLLTKLIKDIPALEEHTYVSLKIVQLHYDRCITYYSSLGGWGTYGAASDEEKRLTMMLFTGLFDALAEKEFDGELFEKALPCLTSIGSALPPDYSMAYHDETYIRESSFDVDGRYQPKPVHTSNVFLNESLLSFCDRFAEHLHDMWSIQQFDAGVIFGDIERPDQKKHPRLKPYKMLNAKEKDIYRDPIRENLRALIAWGWAMERSKTAEQQQQAQRPRRLSKINPTAFDVAGGFNPRPIDISNITLTREMQNLAERLAENSHDVWAHKTKMEEQMQGRIGSGCNPQLVPFDILTDNEKKSYRENSQALLKFLQVNAYRLHRQSIDGDGVVRGSSIIEKRFAYNLLDKLLHYVDKAQTNLKPLRREAQGYRRKEEEKEYKFFVKVVLPLTERFFYAHSSYFVSGNGSGSSGIYGSASNREKEIVTNLFCKLAHLIRQKVNLFGKDLGSVVHCLRVVSQSTDASVISKHSSEATRNGLYLFFRYAADDLLSTVQNLTTSGKFTHVKVANVPRNSMLYNYVPGVLVHVLHSLFDHLSEHQDGQELLSDQIQICCYKILGSLYSLGADKSISTDNLEGQASIERFRPSIGECLAAFAGAFPVAFLEPHLNKNNPNSVLGQFELKGLDDRRAEDLSNLLSSIPTLENVMNEVDQVANSGGRYADAPHVIEVILPMLCSYLQFWWKQGPDSICRRQGNYWTTVNSENLNHTLQNVLTLIKNNMGEEDAPWMNRIAAIAKPILNNVKEDLLKTHCVPIVTGLKERAAIVLQAEEDLKKEYPNGGTEMEEAEFSILEDYHLIVRDLHAFFPLLIKFVDSQRSGWLKTQNVDAEKLYQEVTSLFTLWAKSANFRREEQNFIAQSEAENKVTCSTRREKNHDVLIPVMKPLKMKRTGDKHSITASLVVLGLKRLLPIGMNLFGAREQELIQQVKQKLQEKETEVDVKRFLEEELHIQDKVKVDKPKEISFSTSHTPSSSTITTTTTTTSSSPGLDVRKRSVVAWQSAAARVMARPGPKHWQKQLYLKMATSKLMQVVEANKCQIVGRIIKISTALHQLSLIEQPAYAKKNTWRRLMSAQRKRAIMACFRMIPLFSLPRHRAINFFLKSYKDKWLSSEEPAQHLLIEDLTKTSAEELAEETVADAKDPCFQLIHTFSRAACLQQDGIEEDDLYMSYADIMSMSCSGEDDDDDDDEDESASFEEKEVAKQKLLSEQGRLAERGAAEMVLMNISASKGIASEMVSSSLRLGISLLKGGNELVQEKMLTHLRDKMDVGFFTSMAVLTESCSVLDLEAYERYNKAEGLGVSAGDNADSVEFYAGERSLHDADLTCTLFRFLQLLCEGHNLDFQDYLRTQTGNHTTVNLVNCTVDYLLRLQESISDFYWHYSGREVVDPPGRENFSRAFKIAKQVFRTLTEYIQGPCAGNQLALAHSRLWDAMGGFLHVFAHLQKKLSQDPSQLELLRELLNLQNEMVVMLLSMLEGNVMNGTIGKQMVDMLVESAPNVEMILKFFDMFLKLKDLASSEAFKEYDQNQDGVISQKEFQAAMTAQKMYTQDEIDYLLKCADRNNDGIIDFTEFSDRFHGPAEDIGFNLTVLLTNLLDHMPNEERLERFLNRAESLLEYFEPFLGRIEIMGRSQKIEKVYFEIKESLKDQWEKPQIKESKGQFLHELVNEGGEKEKLEDFVNFCEDTIFEMQHAAVISDTSEGVIDTIACLVGGRDSWLARLVRALRPSNIKRNIGEGIESVQTGFKKLRKMSLLSIIFAIIKFFFIVNWKLVLFVFNISCKIIGLVIGTGVLEDAKEITGSLKYSLKVPTVSRRHGSDLSKLNEMNLQMGKRTNDVSAFGIDLLKQGAGTNPYKMRVRKKHRLTPGSSFDDEQSESISVTHEGSEESESTLGDASSILDGSAGTFGAQLGRRASTVFPSFFLSQDMGSNSREELSEESSYEPQNLDTKQTFLSMFARNFYNLKYMALLLAFLINFVLLFFKVTEITEELETDLPEQHCFNDNCTEADDGDIAEEVVYLEDGNFYLNPILRILSVSHTLVSISMLIAYCALKVPLAIFKREKEIARKVEFHGCWVVDQPATNDIKGQWDKLVLKTRSFPDNYWDKFVKKKVFKKYADSVGEEKLKVILGMENADDVVGTGCSQDTSNQGFVAAILSMVDLQYYVWKWGVIFTDQAFLYSACYLLFSVLGHVNTFFFAAHLLDVAMGFKTLRTVLESVTHNGKQLVLTLLMTCVIIYLYTVLAFNFFRKFYVTGDEGETELKCQNMMTCFVFHLHSGLRAGGGIADEIEAPDGDDYEFERILFDITFFFFVIVILLAIIQGLIIDSFGELRDQQEQVKEDMETKCFICGIGQEYFDKVPHGFEIHTSKEHDLSNYMFYLMYLINKPETEHTGQESYVWQLYQERCWDFFPVGDCFRKQYEEE
ncbi:ryanodine receptor 2-like isoform X4 [Apostichopus japonicus]|uniref:ryanodine receptor 2-like isoform X4 n=1 Tax=Stichopus japonicus TaxID=307972 RepID=UPI003AB3030E